MTHSCCYSVACFEDFVFTAIYGNTIGTTDNIPKAGKTAPGQLLVSRLPFFRLNPTVPIEATQDDLLRDEYHRDSIKNDLRMLYDAYSMDKSIWHDWIHREALIYLGTHESLFQPHCEAGKREFKKQPEYSNDKLLLQQIPQDYVDEMTTFLSHKFPAPQIGALREFVGRTALTHIVTAWWYDIQCANSPSGVRMPYAVRSAIRLAVSGSNSVSSKRLVAKNILVRNAVVDLVQTFGCDHRRNVLDGIITMRDRHPYSSIRDRWIDIENEMSNGNEKSIDLLITDLTTIASRSEVGPESVRYERESLKGAGSPVRRAVRTVARYDPGRYIQTFGTIFPELRLL